MNQKKCLKCGHVVAFDGAPPLACPDCGAIYSKVEAAVTQGEPLRPAPVGAGARAQAQATKQTQGATKSDVTAFAERMRKDSLYPTWREFVKWATWFWYAIAALGVLGAVVSTRFALVPTFSAVGVALFIVIAARIGKELGLMVTDLADASVRMAARQEKE